VPSSISRALRSASTIQSSAISSSDGASRLNNNFWANSPVFPLVDEELHLQFFSASILIFEFI